MEDDIKVGLKEEVYLSKFDGEAVPENEVERLYIVDGKIVSHEKIENGVVVGTITS